MGTATRTRSGRLHAPCLSDQREATRRARGSRYAAAVRAAQRGRAVGPALRLRPGAVRRLLGAGGRQGDPLVHHAGLDGERQGGHEPRRTAAAVRDGEEQEAEGRRAASAAAGLDRRAGTAVRVLPERHAGDRRRAPGRQPAPDARRDQDAPERPPVPLRDVRGHPARGPEGREGDGMSALEQDPQPEVELAPDSGLSRRELLVRSGALVLAFATPAYLKPAKALAADAAVPFPVVPPNALSSWIAVDLQGKVTAFTGRVDLGQGNRTAYAQVVAEELDVALENVEVLMGDTALTVDQGITAASSTVRQGIPSMRQAAADARAALLAMASPKLGAPASALTVENGVVKGGSGSISYGDLLAGQPLTGPITARTGTTVTGPAPIKDYRTYKVV